MSDFIEFTMPCGERLNLRINKIESFYKTGGRMTFITMSSGDNYGVKESPQEIIAKIEEWNKQQTVYNRCLQRGNGAIHRYANCLGCGMLRDLSLSQQGPCGCSKS